MRKVAAVFLITAAATTALPAADRIAANGGDILITPLIHASVQLEYAGKVIQVDPWSRGDLSRARPADLILVTDADSGGHHLDAKAIETLRKPGAPVVVPAIASGKVADGIVLPNGQSRSLAGMTVHAVPAYDLTPGEPYHPKGEANGYVVTLGGKRVYFAGVTECVPEIRALKDIAVAFMPMNLPLDRMRPAAVAECVKSFRPQIVYPYHFDQARLSGGPASTGSAPSAPAGFEQLRRALSGTGIEVRGGDWYPDAAAEQAPAPAPALAGPIEADPGVVLTRLIDRAEVRVSRIELQPGAARRVHTHDDVEFHLWVPLAGAFQLSIGTDAPATASQGQAFFFTRGTPHGFRNVGTTAAAVLEVFVKDPVPVAGCAGGAGVHNPPEPPCGPRPALDLPGILAAIAKPLRD